jgi:LmbE family N-acetylglucosaminyl deacetylase
MAPANSGCFNALRMRFPFVPRIAAALLAIVSHAWAAEPVPARSPQEKAAARNSLDILIFAPHPDDEAIGGATLILRAKAQEQRVGVVLLTNGDGHPALAAVVAKKSRETLVPDDFVRAGALRQQHSLIATARLGVNRDELIFLGYPDSGLAAIYQQAADGSAYEQKFTKKRETYGVTVQDYHSMVHGKAAPYLKASLVGDIAEIIRARQPGEIYVTNEADVHGDHRAAFWFVRDGAREAGHTGPIFTYIVHGKPLATPADRRLVLTPEETAMKRAALLDHQAGTSPIHDHLADEYTKPEEQFWLIRADAAAPK